MKKVLILIGIMAVSIMPIHAGGPNTPDFTQVSTMSIVGVGYSSWSLVMGSTSSFYMRIGTMIDHADQNSQNIKIAITTSNVSPSSTFYGYTYLETDPPWILSIEKARYIWAITDTPAAGPLAQQLIVQELK